MWWILAAICASFLWIAYEYKRAPMMDERTGEIHWDDNQKHTEQEI